MRAIRTYGVLLQGDSVLMDNMVSFLNHFDTVIACLQPLS